MAAGFTRVIPILQQVNELIRQMSDLLQQAGEAATAAAEAMKTGFSDAAENIEDKLMDVLADLIEELKDVKKHAEAAARAVDEIGDTEPTSGPAGPGAQHGADFTVPPGFPRDTFPLRVSSGERVIVIPPGEQGPGGVGGVNNFNMTVNTLAAPQTVIAQYEVMRALVG